MHASKHTFGEIGPALLQVHAHTQVFGEIDLACSQIGDSRTLLNTLFVKFVPLLILI